MMESCVLVVVKATSPPYYRSGRQISLAKKNLPPNLLWGSGGGDSRCWWPGSSAVTEPHLLSGGMGPEAMVVGEVGHWHQGLVARRVGGQSVFEDRWAGGW
jgi:hypothetical protein